MHLAIWSNVKSELRTQLGEDMLRNWIEPMLIMNINDHVACFEVPSQFHGQWVERNFKKQILASFFKAGQKVTKLEFSVRKEVSQVQLAIKPEVELVENNLDARYRFDRFVVGKSNELAYSAAKKIAENDEVSFNPLFLYSGVGLGKTHLMHAISWEIIERNPQKRVLFLSAEQFMYKFVQALRSKEMQNFKESFRSVDVLLVDDVQFISGKDSTQEEFFYTFNALIDQNKQIVLSADRAPGDIEKIEERIRSRLQWGLMVDIHPTDYELRLGILQNKLELQLRDHPNVTAQPGVLEFLAQRISSNVRVLEGALTRLVAVADLTGQTISLDLAYTSLTDLLRVSQVKITLDEIIKRTAEFYNLRISDITGPRRTKAIAGPRQVGMYLSKKLTTKSLPDIGNAFGGRDHTTVLHAFRKIDDLVRNDGNVAEEVETLRRRIEA